MTSKLRVPGLRPSWTIWVCVLVVASLCGSPARAEEAAHGEAAAPCINDPELLREQFDASLRPDRADLGYRARLRNPDDGARYLELMEIREGGPAAKAGLRVGDRIVAIDGPLPAWEHELARVVGLQHYRAGQQITLGIERYGHEFEREVTAAAMPEELQEELIRWAEDASRRLVEHGRVYCSDDADEGMDWADEGSPRWHELFARGQEVEAILTLERTEEGWAFSTEPEIEIPAGITLADLPDGVKEGLDEYRVGQAMRVALFFTTDIEAIRRRFQ